MTRWITGTDVGVNTRALSHLFSGWFYFQNCYFFKFKKIFFNEFLEGALRGRGKEYARRKERAWERRERACVTEKERRGEHSDATPSHAPGSDLPIVLSGFRKALQSWVEHALVFKLPMANHTSFFFCKREPSSKTARFQNSVNAKDASEQP